MTKVSNINGYDLKDKEATENILSLQTTTNRLESQITELASGSPLVASSTSEMTDTTHIYVNTTNGKWYYYDGDSWEIGGDYQAAEDSATVDNMKEDLTYYKTLKVTKDRTDFIQHIGSNNIVQDEDIETGGYYNTNGFNAYATWGYYKVPVIEGDILRARYKNNTWGYLGVFENIDGTYTKIDSYVEGDGTDSSTFKYWSLTIPANVKSVIINLSDISGSKQNWLVVTKNAEFPSVYEPYDSTWIFDNTISILPHQATYLTTDWKNKIEDVQNAKGTKFTFAVQTDTHINLYKTDYANSEYMCNNLKELTSYIGFDFVCNLGDIIEGYTSRSTEDAKADFTEIIHRYIDGACCPVLFSIGNHDDNEPSTVSTEIITNNDLYARVIKPMVNTSDKIVLPGKVAYYYVDFDDIRVIVLNTQDGTRAGQFKISEEQISWFTNTALNTNKAIMIMGHSPLVSGIGSNIPTNASSILNAVNTFKNNGGTVIGFFYGHEHAQNSVIVDNINHICFRHSGIRAEVVMVDLDNNTINTIVVGDRTNTTDRSFEF